MNAINLNVYNSTQERANKYKSAYCSMIDKVLYITGRPFTFWRLMSTIVVVPHR